MLSAKEKMLLDALEPTAREKGAEIVSIECLRLKRTDVIRVYLETQGEETFDQLVSSQEWISPIIDEADPFPGAYVLEVSSPGIDRPLRTPEHFERFAGEKVHVTTTEPIEGRGSWTGELKGMDGEDVLVQTGGQTFAIPYEVIKRANVIGTVDFSK